MVNRTEVDGVPVFWTDAPPPVRAGLLFATGRTDESLITSGHTHLIEHLVLSTLDGDRRVRNGFVGGVVTGFTTMGTPDEIAEFVSGVCHNLSELPGDHLDDEHQILAAESATRSYDLIGEHLSWRYGAAGYGVMGFREMGTRSATIETLRERARRMFTRGNAVMWMTAAPSPNLRFDLPEGGKRPGPVLSVVAREYPGWFLDNASGGVSVSATVPRTAVSTIFNDIASTRLNDSLRTEQAISYSPRAMYDPLNGETAHLVLFADAKKERRKELGDAFGAVIEALSSINEVEVSASRARMIDQMTGALAPPPDVAATLLIVQAATEWIHGRPYCSPECLAAELAEVTADDLAAYVADLRGTALFGMPNEALIRPWLGKRAQPTTAELVAGPSAAHMDAPVAKERLVHGADGVSIRYGDGSHRTVRFNAIAAAMRFQDGGLFLMSLDGGSVLVEPTMWRDGSRVSREIEARLPGTLILDQDPREAGAIPKPTTTPWQRMQASSGAITAWTLVGLGGLAAVATLVVVGPVSLSYLRPGEGAAGFTSAGLLLFLPLMLAFVLAGVGVHLLMEARDPR